jgi:hypothetical protein
MKSEVAGENAQTSSKDGEAARSHTHDNRQKTQAGSLMDLLFRLDQLT